MIIFLHFFFVFFTAPASVLAQSVADPPRDTVTPTVVRSIESITGTVERSVTPPSTVCTSTPEEAALLTSVGSCSEIERVTRPMVDMNGTLETACPSLNTSEYRQLLGINITSLALMNESRNSIANRMSCLLGVEISPAQITHALGSMSQMLCDTSGTATRDFVITCGSSGAGSTASFEGSLPYDPGRPTDHFCGTVQFRPNAISRVEEAMRDRESESAQFRKMDLMDSVLHEQAHALASFLQKTIPGASMSNPPSHSCSVGRLTDRYTTGCRFFDGSRERGIELQIGTAGTDRSTYAPYPTLDYITRTVPEITARLGSLASARRRIEGIRARGRPLTEAQTATWEEIQQLEGDLEQLNSTRVCAERIEANPRAIYSDLDSPENTCGAIPSSRYRNESAARAIARDILISRSRCENAAGEFFTESRVRRF